MYCLRIYTRNNQNFDFAGEDERATDTKSDKSDTQDLSRCPRVKRKHVRKAKKRSPINGKYTTKSFMVS